MRTECQLLGTLGCHLCEQAEAVLIPFVDRGFSVEVVDITERAQWMADYAVRIPVLRRLDSGAELNWPFEAQQVAIFLR